MQRLSSEVLRCESTVAEDNAGFFRLGAKRENMFLVSKSIFGSRAKDDSITSVISTSATVTGRRVQISNLWI